MNTLTNLLDMLTYCRPKGSKAEAKFIDTFITPLPGAYVDKYGNWHVQIGDAPVLWSCHTDSVHYTSGRQEVCIKSGNIVLAKERKQPMVPFTTKDGKTTMVRQYRDCLGADDAAGVFIMTEMIKSGVQGRYVFHYGEECGGLGSNDLAHSHPDWLADTFKYAIAFDRRGQRDVITHQMTGRCCSDEFAQAVSDQLNAMDSKFKYQPSPMGIYTDTANYVELIPECTNISVGYEREHSENEALNVKHILRLVDAMKRFDVSVLPVTRDPNAWMQDEDEKDYLDWFDSSMPVATVNSSSSGKLAKTRSNYRWDDSTSLDPEWDQAQRILLDYEIRNKKVM